MLTLPIKSKWFNMILSGEKTEEYRDCKSYYDKRLMNAMPLECGNDDIYQWMSDLEKNRYSDKEFPVLFRNGYSNDSPSFIAWCSLRIGKGKPEWGAVPNRDYYILTVKDVDEMTIQKIKKITESDVYNFLRTDPHLGENIILLGLGGSYAYGTNVDGSDIDIRGIAANTKEEILLGRPFDQVTDSATDTTIYSFTKIMRLLTDANPNILEMLFLEPEQYLYLDPIGKELLSKRNMFLSQKALQTFGGYARAQLSRLDNKTMRNLDQSGQEIHILRSIQNASATFPEKYFAFEEDQIRLYIDDAVQENMDTEIFMDINLKHYPLRDYKCMWSEMHNIVKDYGKIGKRAKTAMRRNICKHAMHLVRLQNMCLELMETGTMHTYRRADHDFLMDIRNGKYTNENDQMTEEFFHIVEDNDNRIRGAAKHTVLPAKPDYRKINDFICEVNETIVKKQ